MALVARWIYACLLFAWRALSLPINNRQNIAVAFSEDSAKEDQFEFVTPREITKPARFQLPMLRRSEAKTGQAKLPSIVNSEGALQLRAMASFHAAASAKTKGVEWKLVIGSILIFVIVCLYAVCTRQSEHNESTAAAAPKTHDPFLNMEHCDDTQSCDGAQKSYKENFACSQEGKAAQRSRQDVMPALAEEAEKSIVLEAVQKKQSFQPHPESARSNQFSSSSAFYSARSTPSSAAPKRSSLPESPEDATKLLTRCREIMASSDPSHRSTRCRDIMASLEKSVELDVSSTDAGPR